MRCGAISAVSPGKVVVNTIVLQNKNKHPITPRTEPSANPLVQKAKKTIEIWMRERSESRDVCCSFLSREICFRVLSTMVLTTT